MQPARGGCRKFQLPPAIGQLCPLANQCRGGVGVDFTFSKACSVPQVSDTRPTAVHTQSLPTAIPAPSEPRTRRRQQHPKVFIYPVLRCGAPAWLCSGLWPGLPPRPWQGIDPLSWAPRASPRRLNMVARMSTPTAVGLRRCTALWPRLQLSSDAPAGAASLARAGLYNGPQHEVRGYH